MRVLFLLFLLLATAAPAANERLRPEAAFTQIRELLSRTDLNGASEAERRAVSCIQELLTAPALSERQPDLAADDLSDFLWRTGAPPNGRSTPLNVPSVEYQRLESLVRLVSTGKGGDVDSNTLFVLRGILNYTVESLREGDYPNFGARVRRNLMTFNAENRPRGGFVVVAAPKQTMDVLRELAKTYAGIDRGATTLARAAIAAMCEEYGL